MSTSKTLPKGFLRSLFTAAAPGAIAGAALMIGASPIVVAATAVGVSAVVSAAGDLSDAATELTAAIFPENPPFNPLKVFAGTLAGVVLSAALTFSGAAFGSAKTAVHENHGITVEQILPHAAKPVSP